MPRRPTNDYADRCKAVELKNELLTQRAIAQTLHRPERWVRRVFARYDAEVGVASLTDRSSRPHASPNRTPPDMEHRICQMKQEQPSWGRRQIARQLRYEWRNDPTRLPMISVARVRCVLKRHPELTPVPPPVEPAPARQIDYLACNLLWAADAHQTCLADGSTWETLRWLDLHSRYDLGQVTALHLTEDIVMHSFLSVAHRYGLPQLIKTDRDKLFYEPTSGLPTLFQRVMSALAVTHLPEGPHQPWWNGVVERRIQTCQREVHLPPEGTADVVSQAMEAERLFYDNDRCHSRCADRPPATVYTPSQRVVPENFALDQVPVTLQPTVTTRQVQAGGRISLLNRSYQFSQRYAHQTVTVTVDGWEATAQAADGWKRTWDLHPGAPTEPRPPLPPAAPQTLRRKVDRHGSVHVGQRKYYVGIAWATQTLTLRPQGLSWVVNLPDGSTKELPDPATPSASRQKVSPHQPQTPPAQQPGSACLHTRHVTKTGQVAFHNRLYYVGINLHGQTVNVTPITEGLAVYTPDKTWIRTCPWKPNAQPDEPLCPT
jgi:Homeodomain-like domain